MTESLRVQAVAGGSPAARSGVRPGDVLVSVNGAPARDVVDYLFLTEEPELTLVFRGEDGALYEAECPGETDLGLSFGPVRPRTCRNRCPFCFVDQMPRGFRPSLYVKDDDWRSSFLHGTYVTLTNLRPEDLDRIRELGASPLYVSVHATDDAVRGRLLGNEDAPPIMKILSGLASARIRFHAQVVVVPGENDGEVLDRTIRDLFSLRPAALSLSVVPVGLTAWRDRLPRLRPVSPRGARAVLEIVERWQRRCLEETGSRFVFAADELYLKGGKPVPPATDYEDFCQLENGVGLVASFLEEARREMRAAPPADRSERFVWVAGKAFAPVARDLVGELRSEFGIDVSCAAIENRTFGPSVTVTGLLTGADVVAGLGEAARGATLVLPRVMFRDRADRALDDMTAEQIGRSAAAGSVRLTQGGDELIRVLFGREKCVHV